MIMMMTQLLDNLRYRVQLNLKTIQTNEHEIRQILKEPLSNDRSQKLSTRFDLSKKILQENKENIQIQNMIVNFLSKYSDIPDFSKEITAIRDFEQNITRFQGIDNQYQNDKDDTQISKRLENVESNNPVKLVTMTIPDKKFESLFGLTISGKLKFNRAHPFYHDNHFFQSLLDYHIQKEEYEVCAQLVKLNRGQ